MPRKFSFSLKKHHKTTAWVHCSHENKNIVLLQATAMQKAAITTTTVGVHYELQKAIKTVQN